VQGCVRARANATGRHPGDEVVQRQSSAETRDSRNTRWEPRSISDEKKGASGPAFERSSHLEKRAALPHAAPTANDLRKMSLVRADLGVILGHYCSDPSTRHHRSGTWAAPKKRIRTWYQAVLELRRQ